ncbi:MAG: flagellar motor switch protein FliN [Candidatus Marinimicrobia bacterium]|nr:flagellar motor switch protein FliN [Candidatus Neomarinimicrobiota bacterium]
MKIDQINKMLVKNFKDINEIVKQAFSQLFGREISIAQKVSDDTNAIIAISEGNYPKLHISFKTITKNVFKHLLIIDPQLGLNMFAWMIGDEPEETIGDEHIEGIQEAANQIFGQIKTAFDADGSPIKIEDLNIQIFQTVEDAMATIEEEESSISKYNVSVEGDFTISHYVWFLETVEEKTISEPVLEKEILSGIEDEMEEKQKINVAPTHFQDFGKPSANSSEPRNIEMLLDVNLEAVVELGRKSIPIKDVLQLGRGSIIELNKTAGEPLDIYVNNKKLAEGEVVVVDERFGIRITHLIDPKQRLQNLR